MLHPYGGPVRRAILVAKRGGRSDVFRGFGRELAHRWRLVSANVTELGEPLLVTWVPASRRGKADRGYDQGRLMAEVVAAELGLRAARLLRRGSGSQLGRSRDQRLGGVAVRARGDVTGPVLLVDDVITTGASLTAAAARLRLAGAGAVHGLTVAWAASAEELAAGRPHPGGRTGRGVSGAA